MNSPREFSNFGETDFESTLQSILEDCCWNEFSNEVTDIPEITESVQTFQDAGVLTNNKGLIITLEDGSEFQITIVQSKLAN